jgi:hypothetical protein
VKNEELRVVNEETNFLYLTKKSKASWIVHILHRNCLLKYVFEKTTEGTGKPGRRGRQLVDNMQEKKRYCNLNDEALYVLCGKFGLGEAVDLSQDRIRNE